MSLQKEMIEVLLSISQVWVGLVALKAIFIGSDFNFSHWFKYAKEYWNWYSSRETFEDYLKNKEKTK